MNIHFALRVRAAMLAEPQHVYMQQMIGKEADRNNNAHSGTRLCGTAGCIAGWGACLAKRIKLDDAPYYCADEQAIIDLATALDVLSYDVHKMCYPWACVEYCAIIKSAEEFTPGTQDYVDRVVLLIDKFVELHGTPQEQAEYFAAILAAVCV